MASTRSTPRSALPGPLDGLAGAPILSDKDAAAPTLEEARLSGALPGHGECTAHIARLRAALA